jgi:hypothetical protein
MQAGQDTEPDGPHGDGRITRSPATGAAAAMLSACAQPSAAGRWRPAGRSAGRVDGMEEIAERGDRRAIASPGRGPVADDQRRAHRLCGGVSDAVAG